MFVLFSPTWIFICATAVVLPFRQQWQGRLCPQSWPAVMKIIAFQAKVSQSIVWNKSPVFSAGRLLRTNNYHFLMFSDFCAYTKQQNRWNYTICWNTNAIPENFFGQVMHTIAVRRKKKSVCEDYEALEKPAPEGILSEKYSPNFHSSQVRCER